MSVVARAGTLGVIALALAGCGKEEVRTYRVPPEAQAAAPQAGAPNPHAANPHGGSSEMPRLEYQTPAGWQTKPGGSMRVASFAVPGPDGLMADVSVIPMPGTAAPVGDMVNMWRAQLALEQLPAEEAAKATDTINIAGTSAPLFDLLSKDTVIEGNRKARILGVVLPRADTTWFFKLSGEDAHVTSQKANFKSFLQSVSFPQATAPAAATASGGMGSPMGGMGAGALPAGADKTPAKPQWTVPAGWKEEPPTQMLVAKFSAADKDAKADITVSAFPGDVGGLAANVNRWRRQIGLPPLADDAIPQEVKQLDPTPGKLMLVDFTGTDPKNNQPTRLVGLIVPQASQTWFYKLIGDAAAVGAQKEPLIQFAKGAKY